LLSYLSDNRAGRVFNEEALMDATGEVTETERLSARVLELEALAKRTVRKTQSETLGKLALALSKAQGAMEHASKDALNPFFSSKYADLASVWGAVRKPLADNELAVIATVLECTSVKVSVETKLIHSSDEWVATVVTVPITTISKDRDKVVVVTAQHIGSALTYTRRYGLQCVTGNAPAEDDGNLASGKSAHVVPDDAPPASTPPPAPPRHATASVVDGRGPVLLKEIASSTMDTLRALTARITELPEGPVKSEVRKAWNERTKALKSPAAFAGERQSDRDAAAELDVIVSKLNAAATREPGEEG
jgi:hypothetical protein